MSGFVSIVGAGPWDAGLITVAGLRCLQRAEVVVADYLVNPNLLLHATPSAEIVQREVFGPVLTFQTFAGEDEAVSLANSTRYGLSGIVYTGSEERAARVGRAVRVGTVWVNTFLVRDLTAPFGGIGISGIGREGGDYALDFYSDLKTLQVREGTTA